MTPEQQAEELRNFRFNVLTLFHTLYETKKAKLGITDDHYAVKIIGKKKQIIRFAIAEEAIKFYNENNK